MPLQFLLQLPRRVVAPTGPTVPTGPTTPPKDYSSDIAAKADKADVAAAGAAAAGAASTANAAAGAASAAAGAAADAKAKADAATQAIQGLAQAMQDAAHATTVDDQAMATTVAGLAAAVKALRDAQTALATQTVVTDLGRRLEDLIAALDAASVSLIQLPLAALTFGGAVAVQAGDVTVKRTVAGLKKGEIVLWDSAAALPAGFTVRQVYASAATELTIVVTVPLIIVGTTRTLELRAWTFR